MDRVKDEGYAIALPERKPNLEHLPMIVYLFCQERPYDSIFRTNKMTLKLFLVVLED